MCNKSRAVLTLWRAQLKIAKRLFAALLLLLVALCVQPTLVAVATLSQRQISQALKRVRTTEKATTAQQHWRLLNDACCDVAKSSKERQRQRRVCTHKHMHTHSHSLSPSCTHNAKKAVKTDTSCSAPLLPAATVVVPLPSTRLCFVFLLVLFLPAVSLCLPIAVSSIYCICTRNKNKNETKRDETKNEKQRAIRKLRAAHSHTYTNTQISCVNILWLYFALTFLWAPFTHTNVQTNTVGQDLHSANNYTRQISVRNCVLIKRERGEMKEEYGKGPLG